MFSGKTDAEAAPFISFPPSEENLPANGALVDNDPNVEALSANH